MKYLLTFSNLIIFVLSISKNSNLNFFVDVSFIIYLYGVDANQNPSFSHDVKIVKKILNIIGFDIPRNITT